MTPRDEEPLSPDAMQVELSRVGVPIRPRGRAGRGRLAFGLALHVRSRSRLLHDVRQLVGDQALATGRVRPKHASIEEHVASNCECFGAQRAAHRRRKPVRVQPNVAEVSTETRFHEGPEWSRKELTAAEDAAIEARRPRWCEPRAVPRAGFELGLNADVRRAERRRDRRSHRRFQRATTSG